MVLRRGDCWNQEKRAQQQLLAGLELGIEGMVVGLLPVALMTWLSLMCAPFPKDNTIVFNSSLPSGGRGYSLILQTLSLSQDNELEMHTPQLANTLIGQRVAKALNELSEDQCHAVDRFEHHIFERCTRNMVLCFKVYFAVKVKSSYSMKTRKLISFCLI